MSAPIRPRAGAALESGPGDLNLERAVMNIALLRQPIESVHAQWLVLGIFEDDAEAPQILRGTAAGCAAHAARSTEKELTGSLGELTALYDVAGLEASAVLLVGSGSQAAIRAGRGLFGGLCTCQAAWRPSVARVGGRRSASS